MAKGVHHGPDGSFTSENPSMSSLVTKISEINEEVMQGTCTSNRENDVLTQAHGNKEHGGCTRGASIVPWKLPSMKIRPLIEAALGVKRQERQSVRGL
jgi:hypothetical protein